MSQLYGIGLQSMEAVGTAPITTTQSIDLIGLKAVSPRHAPGARVETIVDDAVEQLSRLQEYVGLGELFDFCGRHAPHQMLGLQLIG